MKSDMIVAFGKLISTNKHALWDDEQQLGVTVRSSLERLWTRMRHCLG
jgi:hypothetical protein